MKKIALFLALVLCLSCMTSFVASADEVIPVKYEVLKEQPERTTGKDCYEVVSNGSFELMETDTKPYGWGWTSMLTAKRTFFGTEVVSRGTDAHSGEYSIHVHPTEKYNYCDTLGAADIIAGETYEFSVWMKRLTDSGNASVQLIFAGSKEGIEQSYGRGSMGMNDIKVGDGWVKKCIRFIAPEYAKQMTISLRFSGAGSEVLWDDASLLCITNEMPKPKMPDEKPAIKYLDIKNADFEEGTVGTKEVPGWELHGVSKLTDEYAHSGKYSLDLTNTASSSDGEAIITVRGFEKGATYQISAWILTPDDVSCDMGFWMSYSSEETYNYSDVTTQLGQEKPRWGMRKNLTWTKYIAEFTPPDDCKSVLLDLRHRTTPGRVFADDVQVYMVKAPYALKPETDEVFYYTEWEKGVFTGSPYVMADPVNSKADVCIVTPDGQEMHKESFSDLTNGLKYDFKVSWLEKKGEKYWVRLKVYGADGAVIQEQDLPVYRFDRPTYLGADGVFRKNGKEITFTFGPGVTMPVLEKNPEEGKMTVVQLLGDDSGLSLAEKMDKAYEKGLMAIVNLYSGSLSAGHPDRIAATKRTVENLKDHPALFAWKVMDEPYQRRIPEEQMELAYATIRNIDPHHPVYIPDSVAGGFSWLFRYCDILDIDTYYGADPDAGRKITDAFNIAMEASKGRKPFSLVEQFFTNNGYRPSLDVMRHLGYQSFFAGASGLTFHTLGVEGSDPDTTQQITRPIWTELVEKWAKWERDFMYGCFVTGEYKYVNYQLTNDVLWGTFTDGTDIYAIVLNRNKNASTSVTIPLTDGAGLVSVAGYTAKAMTGDTSRRFTGEGTLSLELAPMEATVWKVSPHNSLNASALKTTKFRDLLPYPWAYNAIVTLYEKGIVNELSDNWYGPGKNITRGDYAMFLVRTLGLTGSGENFADVDPEAEYAKELAIGKANGVINGIGDNKFNPEAEITRQDMMTMTSRAMKLAGAADLGAFSDAGSIADYAQSHVAAMVAEGLIKGNADGTINPRGNTTRAEAAVIMQRIINK
ncbi:MAG: S-layer homology domain-containing protein [Clostridia bacterium]|nr:S-layer homology domain-containing protein [Clostridia bacterium]